MCRGLLASGIKLKQSQDDKVQVIEEVRYISDVSTCCLGS